MDPFRMWPLRPIGWVYLVSVLIFAGCFSARQNPNQSNWTQKTLQQPDQPLAIYEESQVPNTAYDILGPVVGTACQTDVYSPAAKRSDAVSDLERQARARGANALFNVSCENTGSQSECLSAVRCTGQAARIASVQSLAGLAEGGGEDGFNGGSGSMGTGWVVSPTLVATAYDLIEGRSEIRVSTGDTTLTAAVVASDATHNVALLRIRDSSVLPAPIPFAPGPSRLGEQVFTVGYATFSSESVDMRTSTGIVSAQSGLFGDPRLYQTTVSSPFDGASAPLMDFRGQLVGMLLPNDSGRVGARSRGSTDSFTYAVKGDYVQALRDSVDRGSRSSGGELIRAKAELSSLLNRVRSSILLVKAK